MTLVGSDVRRTEDRPLLIGNATFVGDLTREGQLWARVVRSHSPHALLNGVDTTAARAAPGVVDVLTAADVPDARIPIRLPFAETPRAALALQPLLARERVRFVGEPVAVVVAEDPYLAEDAAELVSLDLDELAPVADSRTALAGPELHEELGGNVVDVFPMVYGDADAAFAAAAVVVRDTLRMPRDAGTPLETRGVLAEVDESGRLVVWGAAKVKHFNRDVLARLLGLAPERILLVEGNVGGGFGVRGEFYPEDFLIPFLALRLGRAVKWIEDRHEHFVAANHSREQEHELQLAVSANGELLAFRDRFSVDLGAYVRTQGVLMPLITMQQIVGPYAWRAFELEASAVLTNKTPAGTFRAPGVTEATFVRERMLDRAAGELGLDPVELRRRNLIPAAAMPFRFDFAEGPPIVYDSGDFPAILAALLERAGYDELRAEQRHARAEGRRVGIGVAAFTEMGGIGPWEHARIVPLADGRFRVECGIASLGQGVQTVLAQIAGDQLGVAFDAIDIDHTDTDTVPMGFGAFASRSTVLAGNAIAVAAHDLREKAGGVLDARRLAAEGVVGEGRFEKEAPSFSCGANLSVVELDAETGATRVLKHVVAFDVGRTVNPTLLHGQLAGGAAQGIAAALWEELPYDEGAQPLATSFVDYLLPTAQDLPPIDVVVLEFPAPGNPLGLKGGGEAGVAGAPAAVANAVADALGEAGSHVRELPLSAARVRALLG